MRLKDRLLLGAFCGGLSAIVANLFLYGVNSFLPGYTINMPEATAEFFLNVDPDRIDIITRILGFIWSMIVGGFYSILYLVALDLTGWTNLIAKAIIVVSNGWLIGIGFIFKQLKIGQYARNEPLSIAAFFVAHIVFAITLSLLVKRSGVPRQKSPLE